MAEIQGCAAGLGHEMWVSQMCSVLIRLSVVSPPVTDHCQRGPIWDLFLKGEHPNTVY